MNNKNVLTEFIYTKALAQLDIFYHANYDISFTWSRSSFNFPLKSIKIFKAAELLKKIRKIYKTTVDAKILKNYT